MKKKLVLLLMLMAAMTFVFAGCNGDSDEGNDATAEKVLNVGGTSAVTASMDPATEWEGWYAVRYGVG